MIQEGPVKDNHFGIEDFIGYLTVAMIVLFVVWGLVEWNGGEGKRDPAPRTSTHCEEHEGYMGQVVVVCEAD
jgi:hypothetical protein